MKAFIQGINCTAKTIKELDATAVMLGLPEGHSFIRRRISRAYDLLNSNKVTEITDGIFRVRSQYEPNLSYIVNLNHGEPSCNCPDSERTIYCKHRIASMIFAQKSLSSTNNDWKAKLKECQEAAVSFKRYDWLKGDLQREGVIKKTHPSEWHSQDFETLRKACELDASLFNRELRKHWLIVKERNWGGYESSRRYRFWLITKDTEQLREKCFVCGKTKSQASQLQDELIYWQRYQIKTVICADCQKSTQREVLTWRFDELYHAAEGAVNTEGLPKTAEEFVAKCREAIDKVREKKKSIEANDPSASSEQALPPMKNDGKVQEAKK